MNIKSYIKFLHFLAFFSGIGLSLLLGSVRFLNILNSDVQIKYETILGLNKDKEQQLSKGQKYLDEANEKLKTITPYRLDSRKLHKNVEQLFAENDSLSKKILGFTPFLAQTQNVVDGGQDDKKSCVNFSTLLIKVSPMDILLESPKEGSMVAADGVKMVLELGLPAFGMKLVSTSIEVSDTFSVLQAVVASANLK